ncbi:hypothetical protein BUE80_DR004277 [Diplocarpon rosae]|nr:hypothetical protein BUE80_DR004277 [Diplocarpon rosae]
MYGIACNKTPIDARPSSRSSASSGSSGTITPEAGYTSAMVLSGTRTTTAEQELVGYFEIGSSDDEASPKQRLHKIEGAENKSGINWKFANQGKLPSSGNASFARQLYLHALTYLIRALPSNLTTEEQLSLRSSLPKGVVEPLHLEINSYAPRVPGISPDSQPSFLHRTLASGIVQFFIFLQFIIPHLRYLLSAAYQYDRKHKISETVLSQSIETADSLGKTGLSLAGAIYGIGDGKVGKVIAETAAWFVEGVTGGIHDGVGEGMVLMGAPRRAGP